MLHVESRSVKNLGDVIRAIRARRGETMVQFAQRLGVKQSAVSRYESGKLNPSQTILLLLHSLAESASEKEAVNAALGSVPVELATREEAFLQLAKGVAADLNAVLRAQGTSSAMREQFRDLVVELAGEKYIPLWLVNVMKLWRRYKMDADADSEFAEAVAALDSKLYDAREGRKPRR